jgi:hypothetical protein
MTPLEMTPLEQLTARLVDLENRIAIQEDIQAIRNLHFTYGYCMDRCLFSQIPELFADQSDIYFLNGHFKGKAGARRMWGGNSGVSGPTRGMLFEHIMAQDVIHVAPDRGSARGRFRCFEQGGVHHTKLDAPERIPKQFWEGGLYENEYVREDGIWKIKVFNYRVVWQARFEDGWSESPPQPLMVSHYTKTFPENDRGPDELREAPPRWPEVYVFPFHYPHPVTGLPLV